VAVSGGKTPIVQVHGESQAKAPPIQATGEPTGDKARFFLYEHDAPRDAIVETQWEDSYSAAFESWLLPHLRCVDVYPKGSKWVGPGGWDIAHPASNHPSLAVIDAVDDDHVRRRYVVGLADWPEEEEMTQEELWQWFGPEERTTFVTMWKDMVRNLGDGSKVRNTETDL
jgi:hypothetical protein